MYSKAWIVIVISVFLIFQGCSQPDSGAIDLSEYHLIIDKINEEYGTNLKWIPNEEGIEILKAEGVDIDLLDYPDADIIEIDLIEFEKEMRKIAEKFVGFREHGWNTDKSESLGSFITQLSEVNLITYYVISSETSRYVEAAEHLSDLAKESLSTYTVGNVVIERNPLSATAISIISDQSGTYFGKTTIGHSDLPIYKELYRVPINDADYDIDAMNRITIAQEFEDSVRLNIERHRELPVIGFLQEENQMYHSQQFDVLLESTGDPFNMLLYLIKKNSASFVPDNTDAGNIAYNGQINPDTIVDYYMNDGRSAFEGLFYGYEGEMTREALMNDMIKNNYSARIEPLNALLFTDMHIPITVSKNPADNTYAITIVMTDAQNALYESIYGDLDFSVIVDESTVEFTNIVLN